MLRFKLCSHIYPLEVVGRGSETQLQAGKKLLDWIQCFKGINPEYLLPYHATPLAA